MRKGVKESILAPVLVGSATKGVGLRGLLDAFVRYLPSPADEPPVTAHEPKSNDAVSVGQHSTARSCATRIAPHDWTLGMLSPGSSQVVRVIKTKRVMPDFRICFGKHPPLVAVAESGRINQIWANQ